MMNRIQNYDRLHQGTLDAIYLPILFPIFYSHVLNLFSLNSDSNKITIAYTGY